MSGKSPCPDPGTSTAHTAGTINVLRDSTSASTPAFSKYTPERERLASLCVELAAATGVWMDPLPDELAKALPPCKKMRCYHCSLCGAEKRGHQCPYAPENMAQSAFFLVSATRSHKSLVKLRKAAQAMAL
jgi:hypothetical protein